MNPLKFRFTLTELSDFICEFTKDGERRQHRDVLDWFRWFERKCGLKRSLIRSFGRRPTYPGESFFREHNPNIRRAEENWERRRYA